MSCLIPLIAGACLLDLGTLEIEVDASYRASGSVKYWITSRDGVHLDPYSGSIGRAAVGFTAELRPGWELRYGVEHRSYLESNRDRGEERYYLGFAVRPFARR